VPVTQTKEQRRIEREGLTNTSGGTEIASYEKMMKGWQRRSIGEKRVRRAGSE